MRRPNGMTRREFIAAGAGIAGLGTLVAGASVRGAAGRGRSGPGPLAQGSSKSRVVLVRTDDRADGVKRCLDLWNANPFQGKRVLVKPNFNTSDETPGSTHNDTLRALLTRAKEMGAATQAIGDRSGPEPPTATCCSFATAH